MAYLILIRHGQSTWNAIDSWTGLTDISLDEKGREQARKDAELIKDYQIDLAFTSKLRRAKQTLDEIKNVLNINPPTTEDTALNERDYGDFTGRNKLEVEKEYGQVQYLQWRRGWDVPIPNGETLKDVYERVVPYYKENIFPQLKGGKNVLISAHGNSLRALVKFLENISDFEIPNIELKTGEIYIYNLNSEGNIISKEIKS